MGKKAREIIDIDANKVINMLNKAYANEWLAHYQYWIGAKIVTGPMKKLAAYELSEHADEERDHADRIAERIIQLGGTPLLSPQDWYEETSCGYKTPTEPTVDRLIEQNLEGERCAIDDYQKLLDTVKDKDPITYNLILDILDTELEHEEDLQSILEDINVMKKKV